MLNQTSLISLFACVGFFTASVGHALPSHYTELNDYVIEAPHQGTVNTCLFMAATGALEILLSKKNGILHPETNGPTDLSERYTISEEPSKFRAKTWFEDAFLKFDSGTAVLNQHMPFESFSEDGAENERVWDAPANFASAPRIRIPAVDTILLFSEGDGQFDRGVLNEEHLEAVKEALVKYRSPIIAVGNDEDFWHVTLIVGYDDDETGRCHGLDSRICARKKGILYVRDSFGTRLEKRSYEWFIRRENSAAVAKFAE